MALCLLALAGIPPMAGFLSKLFIFFVGLERRAAALTFLVILGLINSTISMVYYGNVVWRMYVIEPAEERAHPSVWLGLADHGGRGHWHLRADDCAGAAPARGGQRRGQPDSGDWPLARQAKRIGTTSPPDGQKPRGHHRPRGTARAV